MRPEGWENPHLKNHMSNIAPELCGCWYCREWMAFEAGADALLTSFLRCGIISISQLEVLKNNGDDKGETK